MELVKEFSRPLIHECIPAAMRDRSYYILWVYDTVRLKLVKLLAIGQSVIVL